MQATTNNNNNTATLPPLNDKQKQIVLMAMVFGFVTIAAVMRIFGWSYEAATGSLGALVRRNRLRRIPLRFGLTGFQATLGVVRELGANPTLVRPFAGPQSILPRFAGMTDCIIRNKMPLAYSNLKDISQLRSEDYRLIPGEQYPVCYAVADLGTNPLRLLHRVNAHWREAKEDPVFRKLIEQNAFAVRILTPSEGKAKSIADLFTKRKIGGPVEIRAIPEMQDFLA